MATPRASLRQAKDLPRAFQATPEADGEAQAFRLGKQGNTERVHDAPTYAMTRAMGRERDFRAVFGVGRR